MNPDAAEGVLEGPDGRLASDPDNERPAPPDQRNVNLMLGNAFSGWHLVIILVVIVLLFGSTKLPALAKSVGQSMRIFKGEVKTMKEESGSDLRDEDRRRDDDRYRADDRARDAASRVGEPRVDEPRYDAPRYDSPRDGGDSRPRA
jgi:sec-independent protein translocase protein TatA